MKIFNEINNTNPLIVHCQGVVRKTKEWGEIINNIPKINNKTLSNEITIITFMSNDGYFPLKEQLIKSKIKYINATPKNILVWKNTGKIKYLTSVIDKIKTPYVLCLDASDVICCEDLSELVGRFKLFDVDILYNGSKNNFPSVCNIEEITTSYTPFKYLNAGMLIGKTDAVKEFYNYIVNTELYKTYGEKYNKYLDSEQLRIRLSRKHYKNKHKIMVDTECKIFQTLSKTRFKLYDDTLKIINTSAVSIKPININGKIGEKMLVGIDKYIEEDEQIKIVCYCKILNKRNKILKNIRKIDVPSEIFDIYSNNDMSLINYIAQTQLVDVIDVIEIEYKMKLLDKIKLIIEKWR